MSIPKANFCYQNRIEIKIYLQIQIGILYELYEYVQFENVPQNSVSCELSIQIDLHCILWYFIWYYWKYSIKNRIL